MSDRREPSTEAARRHWLCIAYAFPPIRRSGTHRTSGFVRHLDRLGWDATVLTVEPDGESLDESLLQALPHRTRIRRTRWVDPIRYVKSLIPRRRNTRNVPQPGDTDTPTATSSSSSPPTSTPTRPPVRSLVDWFSRLLITPDSRTGWIPFAIRAGFAEIRRCRPDVLYSTSPYMSAHLIGWVLSKWFRIPWVADFRDPWRGHPFRSIPYRTLDWWDAGLERLVLRGASRIIVNTPAAARLLERRAPVAARKSSVILNGFDREQVVGVVPVRPGREGEFVITHCGQFYGPRTPMIWLSALRLALRTAPHLSGKLRLALIGPESFEQRSLTQWAAQAGVSDHVIVLGQKGHAQALSLMAGSDALILAGSTTTSGQVHKPATSVARTPDTAPHDLDPATFQVPAKLFEYLALRRPIIANFAADGPVVEILEQARAQALIREPDDVRGLADAMIHLAQGHPFPVTNPWSGVERFDRAHRAAELADLFAQTVADHGGLRSRTARTSHRDESVTTRHPSMATPCGGVS